MQNYKFNYLKQSLESCILGKDMSSRVKVTCVLEFRVEWEWLLTLENESENYINVFDGSELIKIGA